MKTRSRCLLTCVSASVQSTKKFMTIIHMSGLILPFPSPGWNIFLAGINFIRVGAGTRNDGHLWCRSASPSGKVSLKSSQSCAAVGVLPSTSSLHTKIRPSVSAQVRRTCAVNGASKCAPCAQAAPSPGSWQLKAALLQSPWEPRDPLPSGGGNSSSSPVIIPSSLCAQQQWLWEQLGEVSSHPRCFFTTCFFRRLWKVVITQAKIKVTWEGQGINIPTMI